MKQSEVFEVISTVMPDFDFDYYDGELVIFTSLKVAQDIKDDGVVIDKELAPM